tara:strand:+ start:602 stop:955 length:354 start_codon:yes stop_codon:yes gene_type:complete
VADEVNWSEYFASIVSVCPWSKAYWLKQKIDVCKWTGEIKPLGSFVARIYLHPRASGRRLKKMMWRMNEGRPNEEWLYSHPQYGGHSTPVGVLIQQDLETLTKARKGNKNNESKSSS